MKKYIMLLSLLIMLLSCSSNPTPSNPETGITAKVYDCDEQPTDMAGTAKMPKVAAETNSEPLSNNNVYFECIGENQLRIRCQEVINCAGTLTAECIKNGNKILLCLVDSESELQANCICSHWVEQVLTDIAYGKYEVTCNYQYVSPTSYFSPVVRWQYELEFNEIGRAHV